MRLTAAAFLGLVICCYEAKSQRSVYSQDHNPVTTGIKTANSFGKSLVAGNFLNAVKTMAS